MPILKRVRVIKKIQEGGAWRFVSLKREGKRHVWDPRPGTYASGGMVARGFVR